MTLAFVDHSWMPNLFHQLCQCQPLDFLETRIKGLCSLPLQQPRLLETFGYPFLSMATNNSPLHNPFRKNPSNFITFIQPAKNPFLHASNHKYILANYVPKSSNGISITSAWILQWILKPTFPNVVLNLCVFFLVHTHQYTHHLILSPLHWVLDKLTHVCSFSNCFNSGLFIYGMALVVLKKWLANHTLVTLLLSNTIP